MRKSKKARTEGIITDKRRVLSYNCNKCYKNISCIDGEPNFKTTAPEGWTHFEELNISYCSYECLIPQ